jgi:hypothetical protein
MCDAHAILPASFNGSLSDSLVHFPLGLKAVGRRFDMQGSAYQNKRKTTAQARVQKLKYFGLPIGEK